MFFIEQNNSEKVLQYSKLQFNVGKLNYGFQDPVRRVLHIQLLDMKG